MASKLWLRAPAIIFALGFFLFTIQIAQLVYFVAQNSDSRAVISAIDNDAAGAIDVVQNSAWFRDNRFRGYGPVYYRISHTIASVLPDLTEPGNLSANEAKTKKFHFALLLTSLFSLSALGLLLAYIFIGWRAEVLIFATLFVWAFLQSDVWRIFLLRAHPDMLLSVLTALASFLTVKMWRNPNDGRYRKGSAWVWGVALGTKLSVLPFLPFVVGWTILNGWRKGGRDLLGYLGHVFLAFCVIGFPQNHKIYRIWPELRLQTSYIIPATGESVGQWLNYWCDQIKAPFLLGCICIILIFIFRRKGPFLRAPQLLIFQTFLFMFGPLIALMSRGMLLPHEHYPMPYVASQMAVLLATATAFTGNGFEFRKNWLQLIIPILAVGFLIWRSVVPVELSATLSRQYVCRPEARIIFAKLDQLHEGGEKIYYDPYVPVLFDTDRLKSSWQTDKKYISENRFTVMFLKRAYYSSYFDQSGLEYYKAANPNWRSTLEFYNLFAKTDIALSDAAIGKWKRTFNDQCSWEIWQKQ